ncbi:hypothetical protein Tco_0936447 [Tanacetum coccineum]
MIIHPLGRRKSLIWKLLIRFLSLSHCTSSDDDSFKDIDYVEASLPDYELVSLEEVNKDILHDKLLNTNLPIACDLPSSDDFSPISIFEEKSMTFSNPLFDSNKDECFTPSDDVELLLHHDPSISVVSILEGFTDEPPLEENDDLFDLESKENDWKKILYDAPIDDLISEDKVFDLGIHEIYFSPTYASLTFKDRLYLSFTYVIRTFLPYFTYPVVSPFLFSSGSEDTILDPGISAFHFSSLEPVAYKCPMEVCSSTCFVPNITMISGESS